MIEWSLDVTIEVARDGCYRESISIRVPMRDHETTHCAAMKAFEAVHEALAFYSRQPQSEKP